MNSQQTLDLIVDSLLDVGVVGNEPGRYFEPNDLPKIEADARSIGYTGGALSISHLIRARDGVDILVYDGDRFYSEDQAEQAWASDYNERWRSRVSGEVEDWLRRLSTLRCQIQEWIASIPDFASIQLSDLAPAKMSEHLMQRFGVPPAFMPVFELRMGTKRVMRFQPKGLWVIGANGRIDLVTKVAAPILIDTSEPLSSHSEWQLFFAKGGNPLPFDKNSFEKLVRGGMP